MNNFSADVSYLWNGEDKTTDVVATIQLRFQSADFGYESFSDEFKKEMFQTLYPTLQEVVDSKFGASVLQVRNSGVRNGSIEVWASLVAIGGTAYTVIKDYETLRKNIKLIISDLESIGNRLFAMVHKSYIEYRQRNRNRGTNGQTISH